MYVSHFKKFYDLSFKSQAKAYDLQMIDTTTFVSIRLKLRFISSRSSSENPASIFSKHPTCVLNFHECPFE